MKFQPLQVLLALEGGGVAAALMLTVAEADAAASYELSAVTVAELPDGTLLGAV